MTQEPQLRHVRDIGGDMLDKAPGISLRLLGISLPIIGIPPRYYWNSNILLMSL